MAERARSLTAVLPVLLAVLSAGLAPHLHHHPLAEGRTGIAAASRDGAPALRGVVAGECVMCRSGQSSRLAIAGHTHPEAVAPAEGGLPLFGAGPSTGGAWLVRGASPPRAPPV